jgi:hypothetical protein
MVYHSRIFSFNVSLNKLVKKNFLRYELCYIMGVSLNKSAGLLLILTFLSASCIIAVEPSLASEGSWASKARMGLAKTGFGVGVLNNKIYVIGGHPYDSTKVTIDDVSVYDPATDEWHSKQPMPGSLAWFGTAVYQDEIYVMGGAWFLSGSEKSDVWVYSPAANSWTTKTSMPTARGGVDANVVDGKIYVIGGATADSVLDVNEVYDPVADTLQNPRFERIHLHSFRHWRGTMEYAKTKDLLWVMHVLGHKNIKNTQTYMHLCDFSSEEYLSAVAKTIDEARKLIESGFSFVCDMESVKLFSKRK